MHDAGDAAQTRPMPIVPEQAGHQDGPTGITGTTGGPPAERPPVPRRKAAGAHAHCFPVPPTRELPGPEKPQKKSAGRNLRAAIGVGVGLGVVILASLFVYKPVFIGVIAIAVVVGLWELTSRLAERKDIRVPLVPLAVGGAAMVVAGYVRGAEGAWVAMALTALAVLVWRMTEPPENYLRDVTAGSSRRSTCRSSRRSWR